MERWSDPEQVFVKYSEVEVMKDNEKNQKETITCIHDKRIMTLFQVKCALLELFGEEITTANIKESLERVSSNWSITGITYDIFILLIDIYKKSDEQMLYEAYKEFDKMGKGFITAADFRTVVHSCLPHLSTDTIDRIFSAADMYQVQKVTFPQFKTLMKDVDISEVKE